MTSSGCLERRKDGGWGWVVVVSALLSQVLLGGICLSGGLFYMMYRNAFNSDPFETSWLCALPITLWFYSTPIGSFLTNRYGYRVCAFIGGVITATGLTMSFFAPNFAFLFFSHGILTGMGFGIHYTACMTAVNAYFDRYKTLATGLCTIGHNAGLVIYSFFIIVLEETYGWRGSLLIHGALTLNLCFFALIFAPVNTTSHPVIMTSQELEAETPLNGNVYETGIKVMDVKKKTKKKLINLSVLKKSEFLCFCMSNILVNISQGIYILHLPSYAKEIGFSGEDIGTVLTVYGITNVIGKIVYSSVGQHPRADVTVVYSTSLIVTGVCMGLAPVFTTRVGMLTLASLVGFFYCVTGALLAAVIFRIVGFDRFADGVGLAMPFKATGNLIGGPLAGFLYASTGDYSSSFYLAGLSMVLGALFMVPPIFKHRRDERNQKLQDHNTVCEKEVLQEPVIGPNTLVDVQEQDEMAKMV